MCFVFYRHLSPTDVASLVSQSPTVRPPDAFAPAQLPDAASFVRGKGTPQGGVISPLLSNLYLHWFDKLFHRADGPAQWAGAKMVRYAGDFVVLARYQGTRLKDWIESKLEGWLGLEINREKTRVVNLKEEGASLDFLGFTFHYYDDLEGRGWRYLNVSPSAKALKKEREKLHEMTDHRQCSKPIPQLIGELNRHLQAGGTTSTLGIRASPLERSTRTFATVWCNT